MSGQGGREGADLVQQPGVLGAGALEQDGDVTGGELVDDLTEGPGAGGVEHADGSQPEDDHADVADAGELGEEPGGGAEEQRAVQAVRQHVLGQQRVLLGIAHAIVDQSFGHGLGGAGQVGQGEHAGHGQADTDGEDEVEGDGGAGGQGEHGGVAAGGAQDGSDVVALDHAVGGDDEDSGEGDQGDGADQSGGGVDDDGENAGVGEGREPGAGPGAGVDGGAGDGARGGHAAEEPGGDVGEALAEQLAVGVVAGGVGHAVGDPRREEALQAGEERDGQGRDQQRAQTGQVRKRRGGQ